MSANSVNFVRFGKVVVEWDSADNMSITRETDGTRIYMSSSEWNILLKVAEIHGWPSCPPFVGCVNAIQE